ncbi:MAG: pyruvate-formate lyase [Lachnospiraceae bacterium]|nr:pyruvate-formate lyase [Lachnospiraceae bacterium]
MAGSAKRGLETGQVEMTEQYLTLIQNLHDDKILINRKKIERLGTLDIDDHGFIDFPDFSFSPELCADGLVYGGRKIASNFRKFLNQMPAYINENSALAGCWIGNLTRYMPIAMPEQAYDLSLQEDIKKYGILQSGFEGMNHLCPDLEIGLRLGWRGLLDKIRYYRQKNQPADTAFYDGEEELITGILEWIERLSKEAEKKAACSQNGFEKANYTKISHINRKLLDNPPESFREACQFLAHFQTIDRMYFVGGALGNLDQLLNDYFERDMEQGKLTEAEAVWILSSLFFNDTHYAQIGGVSPAGDRDMTNRLSFVALDAVHYLHIPTNISVRVHERLPGQSDAAQKLLERAVAYTMTDGTGVSYSLEKGTVEGYSRNGYAHALGRMRCKSGCNWTAIPGREYPLQDVTRVNMAMALFYALNDWKEEKEHSMDRLFTLFAGHLNKMITCIKKGYDRRYETAGVYTPEIVLNLFMHGPVERGIDASCGGVDIMNFNIDGIGLATAADSFAAIEQRVVKEKQFSFGRLFELLENDYQDGERERLLLKNIERFGTPESRAEYWALKIRDEFVRQCRQSPTPKHHLMIIPGLFSHGDVVMYGKQLPATPNGRKAGEPISHSSEPDPGFAIGLNSFSPVLKARAVAKAQGGYGNSAPLHLDIDLDMLNHAGGVEALVTLIQAHEQMGGTLINLNCLQKETLLAAHERPEDYPDLIVRVTGYSAFFASLSREYRQQIVDRFLEK